MYVCVCMYVMCVYVVCMCVCMYVVASILCGTWFVFEYSFAVVWRL